MEKQDYPLMMQVDHVAEVLDVSRRRAYEIMDVEGFPLMKIGNRKRTPRDKFFEWLENEAMKGVN